jgi:hypothetical protein
MSSRIIYFPVLILIHTLHIHMLTFYNFSILVYWRSYMNFVLIYIWILQMSCRNFTYMKILACIFINFFISIYKWLIKQMHASSNVANVHLIQLYWQIIILFASVIMLYTQDIILYPQFIILFPQSNYIIFVCYNIISTSYNNISINYNKISNISSKFIIFQ